MNSDLKKNIEKDEIILSMTISDENSEMVIKLDSIIEKELEKKKFTINVPLQN